jgi:hypothetical protein
MTALSGTDLGRVFGAMAAYLPQPTGPDGSGPTSFADPDRTSAVLTEAGFEDVVCTRVEAGQVWGRDIPDAARFMADWGPVRHHLDRLDSATAAKATEALAKALEPFAGPDAVRLRGTAWLVTGRRP